jgi:hypothetical protein
VRPHPTHQPVASSRVQTLVQGDSMPIE